jgi:hypothetical protein
MSATSSADMIGRLQSGVAVANSSRSNGLVVLPIVVVATWVYRAVVDKC